MRSWLNYGAKSVFTHTRTKRYFSFILLWGESSIISLTLAVAVAMAASLQCFTKVRSIDTKVKSMWFLKTQFSRLRIGFGGKMWETLQHTEMCVEMVFASQHHHIITMFMGFCLLFLVVACLIQVSISQREKNENGKTGERWRLDFVSFRWESTIFPKHIAHETMHDMRAGCAKKFMV